MVSDRGTHVINEVVARLIELYLVKHRKTTPYHPKANGLTERFNGIIFTILKRTVEANQKDWDDKLFAAVYAYNLSYKTTTGHSPFFMVFGLHALVPIEFEVPTLRTAELERMREEDSMIERAYNLEELEEIRIEAGKRAEEKSEKMKQQYDSKLQKEIHYQPEQLVLLYDNKNYHFPGKLHLRWLGPYHVVSVEPNGAMLLATMEGEVFPTRVHYDRVKPYYYQE